MKLDPRHLVGGVTELASALGIADSELAGVLVLLEVDRFRFASEYLAGDLMTLANALSYGLYIALSRRVMARNDPLAATAVVFAFEGNEYKHGRRHTVGNRRRLRRGESAGFLGGGNPHF